MTGFTALRVIVQEVARNEHRPKGVLLHFYSSLGVKLGCLLGATINR